MKYIKCGIGYIMHSVCAIPGAFSNHVRWLMLLSNEYNSDRLNSKGFIISGKSFPLTSTEKVEFIREHVYPNSRKFYNWLRYESLLRDKLDTSVLCTHHMTKHNNPNLSVSKTILLRAGHMFCVEKYVKLHPFFILDNRKHNMSTDETMYNFFKAADEKNSIYVPKDNHRIFSCRSEAFYDPILNKEYYDDIIDFLEISNEYEQAQQIHTMWYNLHQQAKSDCIDWLLNSEYPNFPWDSHYFNYVLQGRNMPLEDYNMIKKYAKKIYGLDDA